VVYLDSSAIVKLVIAEPESAALQHFLQAHRARVSCALAKVEVIRAVRAHGAAAVTRARQVLRRIDILHVDEELLEAASMLDPIVLRSLDALHLAAARAIGDDLTSVVTYDPRMSTAAAQLGLAVDTPR
jgi:predicted nucleic acid-binding protein